MGTFITPNGTPVELVTRGDTNDAAMAHAILSEDEYRLQGRRFSGWALDIGSHIGSVGLALAVDNPDLSVICVEPVPENCSVIRQSIESNRLTDRVFVEQTAFGKGHSTPVMYDYTDADFHDKSGIHDSRYVGNVWRGDSNPTGTTVQARTTTLRWLANHYDAPRFAFCKIDCEGCEVHAFASGVDLIDEIIGEFHDNLLPMLRKQLAPTHDVDVLEDRDGIGLFRAVRR